MVLEVRGRGRGERRERGTERKEEKEEGGKEGERGRWGVGAAEKEIVKLMRKRGRLRCA